MKTLGSRRQVTEENLAHHQAGGRMISGLSPAASPPVTTLDLRHVTFDPDSKDLQTTWSSSAKCAFCINVYPNGISFSIHSKLNTGDRAEDQEKGDKPDRVHPHQFHLRLKDTRDYGLPTGKYYLLKETYGRQLELQLSSLHKEGILSSSVCYLGVTADPFLSFHKKFDVTMKVLELLEAYQPGFLVVQTRSPMVISALPLLKSFGNRAVVAIAIETPLEQMVTRYTPGQPCIGDRLLAADGLRKQGIPVNLVASPVLPYGDFYRDAWAFADLLVKNGDFISFGCLATGAAVDENALRTLPLARKLVADKNFRWLRPYSYRYLYFAVQSLAPEKLKLPVPKFAKASQLSLFAA